MRASVAGVTLSKSSGAWAVSTTAVDKAAWDAYRADHWSNENDSELHFATRDVNDENADSAKDIQLAKQMGVTVPELFELFRSWNEHYLADKAEVGSAAAQFVERANQVEKADEARITKQTKQDSSESKLVDLWQLYGGPMADPDRMTKAAKTETAAATEEEQEHKQGDEDRAVDKYSAKDIQLAKQMGITVPELFELFHSWNEDYLADVSVRDAELRLADVKEAARDNQQEWDAYQNAWHAEYDSVDPDAADYPPLTYATNHPTLASEPPAPEGVAMELKSCCTIKDSSGEVANSAARSKGGALRQGATYEISWDVEPPDAKVQLYFFQIDNKQSTYTRITVWCPLLTMYSTGYLLRILWLAALPQVLVSRNVIVCTSVNAAV